MFGNKRLYFVLTVIHSKTNGLITKHKYKKIEQKLMFFYIKLEWNLLQNF